MNFDVHRWNNLWKSLGAIGDSNRWFERLSDAYSEPHRFYHNCFHISECLTIFDRVFELASNPREVEAALWFHDAIYDTHSNDNEEKSATLGVECFKGAGLPESTTNKIRDLVLATKSHEQTNDPDAKVMVDVDLAILGADQERFLEYETQIRKEYGWVPKEVYCEKRSQILREFLERPKIYRLEFMQIEYEEQARKNLKSSIASLEQARQ